MEDEHYKVVFQCANNASVCISEISNEVNQLIKDGWEPIGGLSFMHDNSNVKYMSQTMIKKLKSSKYPHQFQ